MQHRMKVFIIAFFCRTHFATSYKIIWDENIEDFDFNDFNGLQRSDVRIPNQYFIFPGTKWCGAGNIAENDNDFGTERDTDKCCRNHDFCPDIIEGYQTKYNLTNPSFYTRLNCKCDKDFYKCLKSVNTRTSGQVGHLYFTLLGTQCYRKEHPIKDCKKYTFFPRKKCVEYVYDESQEKIYQWFDVRNY